MLIVKSRKSKWNNSERFRTDSGVRQGRIMFPYSNERSE